MSLSFEPPSLSLPLKGGGDAVAIAGLSFTSPLEGEVGAMAYGHGAGRGVRSNPFRNLSSRVAPSPTGRAMSEFLKDVPFKGSRRVYLAIKLIVLALAVWLALHFLFGVV